MPMCAIDGGNEGSSWSDLPGLPLFAISKSLATPADFSSFRRACAAWRSTSAAAQRDFMASQPPWLYSADYDRLYSIRSHEFFVRAAATPAGCPVSDKKRFAVGFSSGKLILTDSSQQLYLANPFTGSETHSFPKPPKSFSRSLCISTPGREAATFIVVFDFCTMQYCRAGEEEWEVYKFPEEDGTGPVRNMAAYDGRLYALTMQGQLWAFDVTSKSPAPVFMDGGDSDKALLPFGRFQGTWLGESGDELLGITCDYKFSEPRGVARFAVRRFDFGARVWVEKEGLGGRCLLLDMSWGVLSDGEPGRWGGKGDAIYFTDPMRNAVRVFDMKGGKVEDLAPAGKFRWDMFIWVVPRLCC